MDGSASSASPKTDAKADDVFAELLAFSHARYQEAFESTRIDDVLLGAVVGSVARSRYDLIGLQSDGTNHHLRFERLDDQTRLLFRLSHLSEDLTVAKVHGHLGAVVVGYGERTTALQNAQRDLAPELSTLFEAPPEPGVISFAVDGTTGYVYAQISLVLDLDRYFREDFLVELDVFERHVESVIGSLKRILRARLGIPGTGRPDRLRARALTVEILLESRDEMVMGEIVAAMGEERYALIGLSSDVGHHRARFAAPGSRGRLALVVEVDHPSPSRSTLTLTLRAEVRTRLSTTEDFIRHPRAVAALAKKTAIRQEYNAVSTATSRPLPIAMSVDDHAALAETRRLVRAVLVEGRDQLSALDQQMSDHKKTSPETT